MATPQDYDRPDTPPDSGPPGPAPPGPSPSPLGPPAPYEPYEWEETDAVQRALAAHQEAVAQARTRFREAHPLVIPLDDQDETNLRTSVDSAKRLLRFLVRKSRQRRLFIEEDIQDAINCYRVASLPSALQGSDADIDRRFQHYLTALNQLTASARAIHRKLERYDARYGHSGSTQASSSQSIISSSTGPIQGFLSSLGAYDSSQIPCATPTRVQGLVANDSDSRQSQSRSVSTRGPVFGASDNSRNEPFSLPIRGYTHNLKGGQAVARANVPGQSGNTLKDNNDMGSIPPLLLDEDCVPSATRKPTDERDCVLNPVKGDDPSSISTEDQSCGQSGTTATGLLGDDEIPLRLRGGYLEPSAYSETFDISSGVSLNLSLTNYPNRIEYPEGEVTKFGAGESYRPAAHARPRSPPRGDTFRSDRDRSPRRERARSPPGGDSYHPGTPC